MSAPLPSRQISYEIASQDDDAQLRRVLRETPMQGSIELTLEREPSFHKAAAVEGDSAISILGRETPTGRVIGFGSRSVRTATINAQPTQLGYLSQLRLAPTYRARDTISTLVIPVRRRKAISPPPGVEIRKASASDLPDIAGCLRDTAKRFQFMPYWSAEELEGDERTPDLSPGDFSIALRGKQVIGCIAAWDQGSFKQTIVQRYQGALGTWRPLLNHLGSLTGLPFLPPPGNALRHATLSHLGFTEEDPNLLLALIGSAYNHCTARDLHSFTLGFTQAHPALAPAKAGFRHLETRSKLYLVHYEDGTAAADAGDDRAAHLEIATL